MQSTRRGGVSGLGGVGGSSGRCYTSQVASVFDDLGLGQPDPRLTQAWTKIEQAKSTLRRIERRFDDYLDAGHVIDLQSISPLRSDSPVSGQRKVSRLEDKYYDVGGAVRLPLSPVSQNPRVVSPSANQKRVSFSDSPPTIQKRASIDDDDVTSPAGVRIRRASPQYVYQPRGGAVFDNAPNFSPIQAANDIDDVIDRTDSRAIRETEIRFLNTNLSGVDLDLDKGHYNYPSPRDERHKRARKQLQVDPDGLARIKQIIEEQKRLTSPRNLDMEQQERLALEQRNRHRDDDVIVSRQYEVWAPDGAPTVLTRKVAAGPPTPSYRGFNEMETRYREARLDTNPPLAAAAKSASRPANAKPTFSSVVPKPSATSASANTTKPVITTPAARKPPLQARKPPLQATKPPLQATKPLVKPVLDASTGATGAAAGDKIAELEKSDTTRVIKKPTKHKGIITTSSWREGQKLILKELGPMPRLKSPERPIPDDEEPGADGALTSPEVKKLAPDIKSVLDDLDLGESPSPVRRTPAKRKAAKPPPPAAATPGDSAASLTQHHQQPVPAKVRHYDSEQMRRYIAKQQAERKRKQVEERQERQTAAENKKRQLAQLAAKQRQTSAKRASAHASSHALDETFSYEPYSGFPGFSAVRASGTTATGDDDDNDSGTLTDRSHGDHRQTAAAADDGDTSLPSGVSPDVQEIIKEYRQSVRADRARDQARPRPSASSGQSRVGDSLDQSQETRVAQRTRSQRVEALRSTATTLQARLDTEMSRLMDAHIIASSEGRPSYNQTPQDAIYKASTEPQVEAPHTSSGATALASSNPDLSRRPAPYTTRHERLLGPRAKYDVFDTDLPGVHALRKAVSHDDLGSRSRAGHQAASRLRKDVFLDPDSLVPDRAAGGADNLDKSADSCDSLLLEDSDFDLSEHINRKITKILREETETVEVREKKIKPKSGRTRFTPPEKVSPLYVAPKLPVAAARAASPETRGRETRLRWDEDVDPYTVYNMYRRQQKRNHNINRRMVNKRQNEAVSEWPKEGAHLRSQSAAPARARSKSPLEEPLTRSQSAGASLGSLGARDQSPGASPAEAKARGKSGGSTMSSEGGQGGDSPVYQDTFEPDSTLTEFSSSESATKNVQSPSLGHEHKQQSSISRSSGRDNKTQQIQHRRPGPDIEQRPHRAADTQPSTSVTSLAAPPSLADHYRPSSSGRLSPGALERKMAAELYRLDGVDESVRQLTDVERARAVSLAQQETVSLAQILKARQQSHERDLSTLQLKARQEAIDAGQTALEAARRAMEASNDKYERRRQEEGEAQSRQHQTSADLLALQTEAARLTTEAAQQLAQVRASMLDKPSIPLDESIKLATKTAAAAATGAVRASLRSRTGPRTGPGRGVRARSPGSSVAPTYTDTFTDTNSRKSRTDDVAVGVVTAADDVSDDVTPHASDYEDGSVRTDDGATGDKTESVISEKVDEYSLSFDETMTEDEIEERSFRMVLPSEGHRRKAKRDRSASSREASNQRDNSREPASREALVGARPEAVRPRRDLVTSRGISGSSDDFSVEKDESSLHFKGEDSFNKFTSALVQQYMKEEEVRAQHQAALLKLREKALKEKTKAEMAWLEQQKKRYRDKGADDIHPQIRKKQRGLLIKLQQEQAEIKRLREANALATKERKLLLYQQQEINRLRQSAYQTREKVKHSVSLHPSDLQIADTDDEFSLALDDQSEILESSGPAQGRDKVYKSDSELYAEARQKIPSSPDTKVFQKLKRLKIDPKFLTTREKKLASRRRQAESLLKWKQRLDAEEQEIQRLELKALKAKSLDAQKEKSVRRSADGGATSKPGDERAKTSATGAQRRTDESESSIAEELSEGASGPTATRGQAARATSATDEIPTSSALKNRGHHGKTGEETADVTLVSTSSLPDQSYTNDTFVSEHSKPTSSAVNHVATSTAAPTNRASAASTIATSYGTTQALSGSVFGGATSAKTAISMAGSAVAAVAKEQQQQQQQRVATRNLFSTDKSLTPRSPRSPRGVLVGPFRRKDTESESEDSVSLTQSVSETASDASDIELRIRALNEELHRRRSEADRLKKEHKRRRKDRLKAQEASLKKQLEAYDTFISQTKANLQKELDQEPSKTSVKPQIKQPKVNADVRRLKDNLIRPSDYKPVGGTENSGSQSDSSRSGSLDDVNIVAAATQCDVTTARDVDGLATDEASYVQLRLDDDGAESDSSGSTVVSERLVVLDKREHSDNVSTKASTAPALSAHEVLALPDPVSDRSHETSDVIKTESVPESDLKSFVDEDDDNLLLKLDLDLGNDLDFANEVENRYAPDQGQETARTLGSEILDESPRSSTTDRRVPIVPRLDLAQPIREQGIDESALSEGSGDQSARSFHSTYSAEYSDDFSTSDRPATADVKRRLSLDDVDDVSDHLSFESESDERPHPLSNIENKLDQRHSSPEKKDSSRPDEASSPTSDVKSQKDVKAVDVDLAESDVPHRNAITKIILTKSENRSNVEADDLSEANDVSEILEIDLSSEKSDVRELSEIFSEVSLSEGKTRKRDRNIGHGGPRFKMGDRVLIGGVKAGTVRYEGPFRFAPGQWLGVELDRPEGTNDGTVGGHCYFTCRPRHGIFAPVEKVTLIGASPTSLDVSTTPRYVSAVINISPRRDERPALEISDFASMSQEEKKEVVLKSLRDDPEDEESEISISSELDRAITHAALAVESFNDTPRRSQHDLETLVEKIADNLTTSIVADSLGVMGEIRVKTSPRKRSDEAGDFMSPDELITDEATPELLDVESVNGEVDEDSDVRIASEVATHGLLNEAIDHMLRVRKHRDQSAMRPVDQSSIASSDHDSGIHAEVDRRWTPASSVVSNESALDDGGADERASLELQLAGAGEPTKPARNLSPIHGEPTRRGRTAADLEEVARMLDRDLFDTEQPGADFHADDAWIDDDFGLGRGRPVPDRPPPPYPGSPTSQGFRPEFTHLDLQRLTQEVFYAVPHKSQAVSELVGKVVDVFWESRRYGEPLDAVTPPSDYFSDEEQDIESKSRRVYKRLIFDLVGEHIQEMYRYEGDDEPAPAWVKHKLQPGNRFYRGKTPPTTCELLKDILTERVLGLLDLKSNGRDAPRFRWNSSRKKKDHVDEILVQELREEEPEWVNYDDDELAVKMQLTDSIFDLLMAETVTVLGEIQTKISAREAQAANAAES